MILCSAAANAQTPNPSDTIPGALPSDTTGIVNDTVPQPTVTQADLDKAASEQRVNSCISTIVPSLVIRVKANYDKLTKVGQGWPLCSGMRTGLLNVPYDIIDGFMIQARQQNPDCAALTEEDSKAVRARVEEKTNKWKPDAKNVGGTIADANYFGADSRVTTAHLRASGEETTGWRISNVTLQELYTTINKLRTEFQPPAPVDNSAWYEASPTVKIQSNSVLVFSSLTPYFAGNKIAAMAGHEMNCWARVKDLAKKEIAPNKGLFYGKLFYAAGSVPDREFKLMVLNLNKQAFLVDGTIPLFKFIEDIKATDSMYSVNGAVKQPVEFHKYDKMNPVQDTSAFFYKLNTWDGTVNAGYYYIAGDPLEVGPGYEMYYYPNLLVKSN